MMKKQIVRALFAAWLAAALAVGPSAPLFAQDAPQGGSGEQKPAATPAPASSAPVPISLGLAKYDFSHGPSAFPNIIKPYRSISIEQPVLVNSPRIEQLIRGTKLELSLQDTIELALENNLDIIVQRYNPWIWDVGILRARSNSGAGLVVANLPFLNFDPVISSSLSIDSATIPISNPFLLGTANSSATSLQNHASIFDFQYSQGFATGTSLTASWNTSRLSTSSSGAVFDPSVQPTLTVTISQQLLNGFGIATNTRNLRVAKNNRKIADLAFEQLAITTVTNTVIAYWELVYALENVKVQQRALEVSDKLYSDNKKQLDIGTMAPLDVVRAQSEVATNRQNLIVAQTGLLQQQQTLKNFIAKDPLDPKIVNVEIVPTDSPNRPELTEAPSFEESLKEAFAKRPDLKQLELNLKNGDIAIQATHNALLPVATLSGQYSSTGLAGNQPIFGAPTPIAGSQIVDATGQPVTVLNQANTPINIYTPASTPNVVGEATGGIGDAASQIFHNRFPNYAVALTLSIPLRNRAAQADNQGAILQKRQIEAELQQLKNAALLDVRNTYIALEQDRARVDAAAQARVLQQQTFDAEQKKYQLGASTVYLVIQTQRDLIAAEGQEIRAMVDLVEAKSNYERALGRTLEINQVTVADAASGHVGRDTLIPGTINGQVVGMPKSF